MLNVRLKKLREEYDIKQDELAKKLNLSPSTIAMYETGKRQPNNETLLKLSEIFDCSVDYLLGKSDKRKNDFNDDLLKIGLSMKDYIEPTDEQKAKIKEFADL